MNQSIVVMTAKKVILHQIQEDHRGIVLVNNGHIYRLSI